MPIWPTAQSPWPLTFVPYGNFFVGWDRPQSVARAGVSGGILRNSGINSGVGFIQTVWCLEFFCRWFSFVLRRVLWFFRLLETEIRSRVKGRVNRFFCFLHFFSGEADYLLRDDPFDRLRPLVACGPDLINIIPG